MAAKSKDFGMGKGLDALLGADFSIEGATSASTVPISQVESCSSQPRKNFDEAALAELAESIRLHGIIQPLTVRKLSSGYYQIIAGERRWRAARMVGLEEVPVVVIEADDRKAMELAMIENLQREDLNPMEEAEGYKALIEQYGMTQEQAAARVGKSRSAVANAMRLLGLPPSLQQLVNENKLTAGHARALLPLPQDLQEQAAQTVLRSSLSVRQTEQLVKKLLNPPQKKKESPNRVNYVEEAQKELTERLGRACHIAHGKKKGKIEIEYYGVDDLNDLLEQLNTLGKF
jgi:ParB family chromosome partitioning protein